MWWRREWRRVSRGVLGRTEIISAVTCPASMRCPTCSDVDRDDYLKCNVLYSSVTLADFMMPLHFERSSSINLVVAAMLIGFGWTPSLRN